MADSRSRKRKAEKTDEFFHIRAKGQFLKVPKGDELDDRDFPAVKGMFGIENINKNYFLPRTFCGYVVILSLNLSYSKKSIQMFPCSDPSNTSLPSENCFFLMSNLIGSFVV